MATSAKSKQKSKTTTNKKLESNPVETQKATPSGKGKNPKPIRIVAIGASAGGLEPIEQFFEGMPVKSGLAFVIVQHLSPDFRSMMDQLIARHSSMKILHAEDGMPVLANNVYLNPPRTELTVSGGKLHTREYSDVETIGMPIDAFFRSLAEDQKEKAIGIIMSGTGSDGTRGGAEVIKSGGTMIVQEPTSAKFDSMPRSAIERNVSTLQSHPTEMPELLDQLIKGVEIKPKLAEVDEDADPTLQILAMLEKKYGADFGYYKQTTVGRRIRRRALLNQIHSLHSYAELLKKEEEELEALYCDLLIGVTAFFRDKEAFDSLRDDALPGVLASMSEKRQIRIWAPGCASGEEAYSLAILISEYAKNHGLTLNLKIFATDIHFNSIEFASAGLYQKENLKSISNDILDEYFDKSGEQYRVKQNLRKLVVFSPHNLIKDPPFTRMDIVTCRNLLIYFDDIAQKKALAYFHFSLIKDGVLFLGPSESTTGVEDEFEVINKKWRIFSKKRDVRLRESTNMLPLSGNEGEDQGKPAALRESRVPQGHAIGTVAERQLLTKAYDKVLTKYAPPSLLTDGSGELLHIFGNAEKYLRLSGGLFSRKVTDLVHEDLRLIISAGLERVLATNVSQFKRNVTINEASGEQTIVNLGIERLEQQSRQAEHLLITLESKPNEKREIPFPEGNVDSDQSFYAQRIREVEHDLKATEESLQTTIEELETSNEELQATNEELMASNEELQSTNEELHSVNEELYTVSAEHQRKIEELTELNADMSNLFQATDIGTIFLDTELRIRRFTPAAAKTFNLVGHDIGRPVEHITYKFELPELISEIESVLENGRVIGHEVSVDDHAYQLRIMPYSTQLEPIAGIVITLVDVQELKAAQRDLIKQQQLVVSILEQQPDMICRHKPDSTLTFVNAAYCKYFGKTEDQLINSKFIDLVNEEFRAETLESLNEMRSGEVREVVRPYINERGEKKWIHWHRTSIQSEGSETTEIQSVGRDVTEITEANLALEEINEKLKLEQTHLAEIYKNTPVMMHSIGEDGIIKVASNHWLTQAGYHPDEVVGNHGAEFLHSDSRDYAINKLIPQLFETGRIDGASVKIKKKDGGYFDAKLSSVVSESELDGSRRSFSVLTDVSELTEAERILAEHNTELRRTNENLNQFTNIVSHDLTGPLRAIKHTTDWIEQDSSVEARKPIQEHIDRLKDQTSHLSSMLDDLLEYSRVGNVQQEPETLVLSSVLDDIYDVLDLKKEINLVKESLPAEIKINRAPILLIFRNLIENAIKYHDRDKGKITVRAQEKEDEWIFHVQDDGPGIDPKMHEKILLPFRKLERKDKVPGNGMGLALVRKAVESNGGSITIHSNPAKKRGTLFSFNWPKV